MGNRDLVPLFFAEWLIMSIYIDMVCPLHLRFAWRLYVIWMVLGAIPLLLWAINKEDKKKKVVST